MNNRQVAVLAASMRTGGRNMNSVKDMLQDSRTIEADLNERDRQEWLDNQPTPDELRMVYGPLAGPTAEHRFVEAARSVPEGWERSTAAVEDD